MSRINDILEQDISPQFRFITALAKKGHCKNELVEMSKAELRDLYDDEFPTHITVSMPHRNGGTTRNTIILGASDNKRVA